MWRLSRPICRLFCKQAAFKRSLNLCSACCFTSAGLFGIVSVSLHFWGAIVGGGHFRMSSVISVHPCLIDETDASTVCSCWFVLCQLDESWATKSVSGFSDRCFGTDSMAGSSKDTSTGNVAGWKGNSVMISFTLPMSIFRRRPPRWSCVTTSRSLLDLWWNPKRRVAVHTV